jgi:hypothetical protein
MPLLETGDSKLLLVGLLAPTLAAAAVGLASKKVSMGIVSAGTWTAGTWKVGTATAAPPYSWRRIHMPLALLAAGFGR